MYTDSHCHPENKRFDSDRADVFARATAAGVTTILAIGNGDGPGTGTFACAITLAEQHGGVYATVGIHPHEATLATQADFDELVALSRHPKVVGWGEIGLDYYYDHSPREVQQRVFLQQLELAKAAKLAIIIHCRPSDNSTNAWDDLLRLLRENWQSTGLGGVMHCFGGSLEHARASLDLGFVISFAGNVTYPKAQNIRDAAAMVPLDRMFIETDSPYLAPVPHRGKRNEPAFVAEVARQIGELRGVSPEEIGRQTTDNFYHFFDIP
ncbi:MAG TPA: TatD family hydrolase [Candidatus Eisenbacteria bacterium]|nr:TatD family hydrolase [Candidatus Eisenbacteria bacterium]